MRSVVLPLVLATLTLGAQTRCFAQRDSLGPVVVLVHGRGQFGYDSAALRREWKRDLDTALATVGMPKLRDEDVRLAWYADVLDPQSDLECGVTDDEGKDVIGLGSFARGILATLSGVIADSAEAMGARGLFGDILYFLDSGTRCAAQQRVAETFRAIAAERRPVIVVAYSLGSLVTYGYLRAHGKDAAPADVRLITMGSPLGVRELRELMMGAEADSVLAPIGVRSWENIYDPDDVFAAPLAGKVAVKELRDRRTESESDYAAHQLKRYARDRATGLALGRAMCGATRNQIAERCAGL
jgi:hypothetical protein